MSVLSRVVFDIDATPPTTPLSVTATALSTTTIRITWGASSDQGGSGLAGYRVYRATTSGGVYTQVGSDLSTASLSYDDTSLSPSTTRFYRVAAFDGNGNVSAQSAVASATTSAAAPSTYTPTHYVAPFASVAGATNDYDDLGATAWANATNSGTPTTFGTALARAQRIGSADKVRCTPGIYVRAWRGTSSGPGWSPANNGVSGDPIIFFAATPAATNRGSPGSFCELRWSGAFPEFIVPPGGVAILGSDVGGSGGDYVVFDGFYASRTYVPPYGSAGAFTNGRTSMEFRRCTYDYVSATGGAADNFNAIWLKNSINAKVRDCLFLNGSGSGNHNVSCITGYGAQNYLIQNCEFENINTAFFAKANNGGNDALNYGEFSYNRINGGSGYAVVIKHTHPGQFNIVRQNLFIDTDGISFATGGSYFVNRRAYKIVSNTFVGASTTAVLWGWGDVGAAGWQEEGEIYNNLAADADGTSIGYFWYSESGLSFANMLDVLTKLDNNVYYKSGGAANFRDTGNRTFAQYRAAISVLATTCRETSSAETPVTFVGVGDYRLANNGQTALTRSDVGGPLGCYVTGTEEIGIRTNPTYS